MEPVKVAIADANALLREGLKRVLGAQSDILIVGEAQDDHESIDIVERTRPDVLLLDLEIPTRKAVAVLLELKRKNLPINVFVLTFFPDQESIVNTAKAGARGYALKSVLPSTLIQAIRKIHKGKIWADRQLDCAATFVSLLATAAADANTPEREIFRVLSKREAEILALVANGLTNEEISKKLFISLSTVKAHLNHTFSKLQLKNRTEAALLFARVYRHESDGEPGTIPGKMKTVGHPHFKRIAS